MKKQLVIVSLFLCVYGSLAAQPQIPNRLPKQDIAKPVANIYTFPPLTEYLVTGSWTGPVTWATAEAGHSSTIPDIRFTLNGEVIWQSPFPEIVTARTGVYNINGNNLTFSLNYSPYKYTFSGVYEKYTGRIAGTFTQTRMKYLNAPAGYTPGNISGNFSLLKK